MFNPWIRTGNNLSLELFVPGPLKITVKTLRYFLKHRDWPEVAALLESYKNSFGPREVIPQLQPTWVV